MDYKKKTLAKYKRLFKVLEKAQNILKDDCEYCRRYDCSACPFEIKEGGETLDCNCAGHPFFIMESGIDNAGHMAKRLIEIIETDIKTGIKE